MPGQDASRWCESWGRGDPAPGLIGLGRGGDCRPPGDLGGVAGVAVRGEVVAELDTEARLSACRTRLFDRIAFGRRLADSRNVLAGTAIRGPPRHRCSSGQVKASQHRGDQLAQEQLSAWPPHPDRRPPRLIPACLLLRLLPFVVLLFHDARFPGGKSAAERDQVLVGLAQSFRREEVELHRSK